MSKHSPQEEVFLDLLENHKKLVFKIANAYCQDPEDQRDLFQEIVLQLWQSFPRFDDHYAASTWVYRIALNVAISFLRKEKTRQKTQRYYQQQSEWLTWQAHEKDPRLEELYLLIEQLKPLEKALIILYLEGLKNPEIAEVMGLSLSNVSTRLHRIKVKLSEKVNAQTN